jgi:hypothetical protein
MYLVAADVSPIDYLVLIGADQYLERLYGRVLVPDTVARELLAGSYSGQGLKLDARSSALGSACSRHIRNAKQCNRHSPSMLANRKSYYQRCSFDLIWS